MASSAAEKGKRTNSLAFARTDCHTCASTDQVCDRRRPQCTTCLDHGRKCGGFALPLSWDNSRMWLGKPAHKSFLAVNHGEPRPRSFLDSSLNGPEESAEESSVPVEDERTQRSALPRHFRFVMGSSRNRKRRRLHGNCANNSGRSSARPVENKVQLEQQEDGCVDDGPVVPVSIAEDEFPSATPVDQSSLFDSFAGLALPYLEDVDFLHLHDSSHNLLSSGVCPPDAVPDIMQLNETNPAGRNDQNETSMPQEATGPLVQEINDTLDAEFPFVVTDAPPTGGLAISSLCTPPNELNPDLNINNFFANQHETLLRMYDTEFCILPLTSDTALNPFRCRQHTSQGSRLLFNSILALCFQHLNQLTGSWSAEALEQRINATKLLDNALQSEQLTRRGLTLLDPILIMFTLDCTLSALGTWTNHLNRVRSILEACGGPTALDNPRIRSQVGMIIWWDATLALISRQGTIISQRYLDHLIRSERQDQWSFYDLTGCPGDLVTQPFQLADLAKQSEIASSMTWLSFDLTPVMQIEKHIRSWKGSIFHNVCQLDDEDKETNHGIDGDIDEDALHAQQDRHHCAEVWRCSLLLYIERVFKWDRKGPRPKNISRLVRSTLTHVRSCRRTSQTQKQLLLPVFLAGSETSDEDMRDFAIQYCRWWGEKSRYNMFNSVPALLKDIWAEQSGDSNQGIWWGSTVDGKTGPQGAGQIPMQFLFG